MSRRITFLALQAPPEVARQLVDCLHPLGFVVQNARSIDQMTQAIPTLRPAAVFLTWTDDRQTTALALHALSKLPGEQRPPALLLTHDLSRRFIEEGKALGAQEFAALPLERVDLLTRLAQCATIAGLRQMVQSERLTSQRRVLVLEGRQMQSEMMRVFLEDQGCVVDVHAVLREGMTALMRQRYHLVMLDVEFGNGNAVALLAKLRTQAHLRATPFFLLADKVTRDDAHQAIKAGAFDFILRPYHWKSLAAKIARVVGNIDYGEEESTLEPLPREPVSAEHASMVTRKRTTGHRFIGTDGLVDRALLIKGMGELGALPTVLAKVIQTVNDPNTSAREIGDILQGDQVLVGKLLRYANSVFYAKRHRVSTIDQAVVTLGIRTVKSLALGMKAFQFFTQSGRCDSFDRTRFWHHSLMVAVLARLLAEEARHPDAEECFVGGLLHDIGKTILDEYVPDLLGQAQFQALRDSVSLSLAEKGVIGFDHAALGLDLIDKWKLPFRLGQMIAYHHDSPERAAARGLEDMQQVMLVRVANKLAKGFDIGFGGDGLLGPLDSTLMQAAKLKMRDCPTFYRRAVEVYVELAGIIFSDLPDETLSYTHSVLGKKAEIPGSAGALVSSAQSAGSGGFYLMARGFNTVFLSLDDPRWPEKFLMVANRRLLLCELDSDRDIPQLLKTLKACPDLIDGPCIITCREAPDDASDGEGAVRYLPRPYDGPRLLEFLGATQRRAQARG